MTRILFLGDLAPTGFGSVTMGLGKALLDGGDDVRFLSLNEWGSALPEPFASRSFLTGQSNGWIHRPSSEEEATAWLALMRGLFTGESWEDGWTPQAAILLGDFEATRRANVVDLMPDGFPTLHYCPVEGVDLPPRWRLLWDRVPPVAMCQFGADEMEKVIGRRPPVAYHGVAPEFHPVSIAQPIVIQTVDGPHRLRSRKDCRKFFGGDPKRTWLFRADRHMPRKQYNALLRSLMPVLAARPEVDLVLHLSADPDDRDQGGNLHDTLSKYPPALQRRVIFTDLVGAPREVLAALYNAADLYVTNSAEGFGLCVAEALACGTPAIGPHYSSIPEVIGPAGMTVREGHPVDNEYDHFWWHVNETVFGMAVSSMLDHPSQLRALGNLGPAHVRRHFTWAESAAVFSRLAAEAITSEVAA